MEDARFEKEDDAVRFEKSAKEEVVDSTGRNSPDEGADPSKGSVI